MYVPALPRGVGWRSAAQTQIGVESVRDGRWPPAAPCAILTRSSYASAAESTGNDESGSVVSLTVQQPETAQARVPLVAHCDSGRP